MIFDHSMLDGSQFLRLYALLLASAAMLSVIFAKLVRPQGQARPVADVNDLAVLRGGIDRLVEATTTRMPAGARRSSAPSCLHYPPTGRGSSPLPDRSMSGLQTH
jgi:hypothetical protein